MNKHRVKGGYDALTSARGLLGIARFCGSKTMNMT